MEQLTEAEHDALEDLAIDPSTIVDVKRVGVAGPDGDETVTIVTSAGQKVVIDADGARITVGPGTPQPAVVEAPEPEIGDVVPTEEPAPLPPVGAGEGTALPPVEGGSGQGDEQPAGSGETREGNQADEPRLEQSFDEMTVEQLKGLLRDRELPIGGHKADLIERLNAAVAD